jgi:hypothetical protein
LWSTPGSPLSAELFLVYINDLCNGILSGSITAFADDTALSYCTDNEEQLVKTINNDLKNLNLWFQRNSLSLNISKTNVMIFKLRAGLSGSLEFRLHKIECMKFNCNCEKIQVINSTKYLGVQIDDKLSWADHVMKLRNQLNHSCRKLYFMRNACPQFVLKSLYHALIESRLQYGVIIWGGAYYSVMKPVIIGQKYIIRTIAKKLRSHHSLPIFREWNLLPIRHLYFYNILLTLHTTSSQQILSNSCYRLRSLGNMRPPRPNKEIYKRFFTYLAPKVYNLIPIEIKGINNYTKFRKELKRWLMTIDNIEEFFTNPT